MAQMLKMDIQEMIGNKNIREKIDLNALTTDETGLPTLQDILNELEKPGRDPRKQFKQFEFDKTIRTIEDLKPGMVLKGLVVNITNFGAFIDLGIHENGLLHKSQISEEFVSDPADYLKLNQEIQVKITSIDVSNKRIALTRKGL
jgi:uncharacterized protein